MSMLLKKKMRILGNVRFHWHQYSDIYTNDLLRLGAPFASSQWFEISDKSHLTYVVVS